MIQIQVGVDKIAFLHPQMLTDPLDIGSFEPRGIGFTAIGTAQAIDFFHGFFMQLLLVAKHDVLVSLAEKPFIILLPGPGFFFPII